MELSNLSLNELRELARKRQRAAGNKISRLNTQIGVNISSTKLDPRRDYRNVRKYNRNQLISYVNNLNSFVDRKTQYVPDAYGRPINRDLWRKYQQKEREFNKRVARNYAKFKDVVIDEHGTTVDERQAKITPRHRQMYNPAVNVRTPQKRSLKGVVSEKALKALISDMNKKLGSDFISQDIKRGREQFKKLSEDISLGDIGKRISKLSADQFNYLWNFSGFASDLSEWYHVLKSFLGKNDDAINDRISNIESSVREHLERAESL